MNTDIDTLVQQLRSRADGPVDSRALLARVELAHRRRRSRRAVAGAVAAVSLVMAVAFATLAPYVGQSSPPGSPGTAGPPPVLPSGAARTGDVHQVPALPGIGALHDASDVGADPFAVHFATGRFAHPVATAQWAVADGVEKLTFYGSTEGVGGAKGNSASEYHATVTMSAAGADVRPDRTAADLGTPSPVATQRPSIGGVAAAVETVVHRGGILDGQQETTVRWQPVAHVDVVVSVRGTIEPAAVVAFATGLRFDRATRCAVPLRLSSLPSGARVGGCAFRLSNFAAEPGAGRGRGDLLVSGPNGSTLEVRYLGPQSPDPLAEPETTLANGWTYSVVSTDGSVPGAPNAVIRVHSPWQLEAQATGEYMMDDLLLLAGRLAQAGDPEDPQTWPSSAG